MNGNSFARGSTVIIMLLLSYLAETAEGNVYPVAMQMGYDEHCSGVLVWLVFTTALQEVMWEFGQNF